MKGQFFIIILCCLILFSCSKENEEFDTDFGYDYAGLTLGNYVIYDVDSTFYDDFFDTVITTQFQLKEVVVESYIDLEGEEAFVIHRYRKDDDTLSWKLTDVWNAKITTTNYQKVEENIRFIKLIFPTRKHSKWDGNTLNNNAKMNYEYTEIDNQETIGNFTLNNVLTVLQNELQDTLIHPVFMEEKFAKNIGLVYKKSLDKKRADFTSPWKGFDVTMTLSSNGN